MQKRSSENDIYLNENKNRFPVNGFALSLALKQRLGVDPEMAYCLLCLMMTSSPSFGSCLLCPPYPGSAQYQSSSTDHRRYSNGRFSGGGGGIGLIQFLK